MVWTVRTSVGPVSIREQIEPDDEADILALFAACDDWFEAVTGGPSGPGDVQSLFYALPEGSSVDDNRLFTVHRDHVVIGLIDAGDQSGGTPRRAPASSCHVDAVIAGQTDWRSARR